MKIINLLLFILIGQCLDAKIPFIAGTYSYSVHNYVIDNTDENILVDLYMKSDITIIFKNNLTILEYKNIRIGKGANNLIKQPDIKVVYDGVKCEYQSIDDKSIESTFLDSFKEVEISLKDDFLLEKRCLDMFDSGDIEEKLTKDDFVINFKKRDIIINEETRGVLYKMPGGRNCHGVFVFPKIRDMHNNMSGDMICSIRYKQEKNMTIENVEMDVIYSTGKSITNNITSTMIAVNPTAETNPSDKPVPTPQGKPTAREIPMPTETPPNRSSE